MEYFYTDRDGRTVRLELTYESEDEMQFVDVEEIETIETSEFTSKLIDEIGLSGEELMYCVQCTYDHFDRLYERWVLESDFSTADIERIRDYVNAIIDDVKDEGDNTDPFFFMEHVNDEQAHNILHGSF